MSTKTPCIDCGNFIRKPALRCQPCHLRHQQGENNPNWKGGISQDRTGYERIYRERHPQRTRARSKVCHAIQSGQFSRQSCQWPGCRVGPERTEAHHWSYQPGHELDVTCFCRKHHRQADKMTREQFEFIRAAETQWVSPPAATGARWLEMILEYQKVTLTCGVG